MTPDESIADWQRMYLSLTDPDEQEKAKRATERAQRIEERKHDAGL